MKERKTAKTWEKTRLQNLVRHKSGRYYARLFADGKEIWRALKTEHFSIAEAKLAELMKEHRKHRPLIRSTISAKMTFGEATVLHQENLKLNIRIKPRTRDYWNEVIKALLKSWPLLEKTELRRITSVDCKQWAAKYAKTASATRYNNTLAVFRHVCAVAIEAGVLYRDPSLGIKRARILEKELLLPSRDQFRRFIAEMRNGQSRDSGNCADLASGLAYTGCRISEAARIKWKDVEFNVGELVVRGDPITSTKNWEVRRVPLIADCRALFERMLSEHPDEQSDREVFRVRECQKSMDRAARIVGMSRVTHHNLRDLFATTCIEAGVDIPTVSRWLGHKDGGALLMKKYGHLRREHSIAEARKVTFDPLPINGAKIPADPSGDSAV